MSTLQIIGIAYGFGLAGAYLAWLAWVVSFEDYRCPTPRAMLGMFLAALTVVIPWLAALVWGLGNINAKRSGSSWWSRPICRSKP